MQVTKGIWRMRENSVSFSSSPAKEPGNEARIENVTEKGH